MHIGHLRELAVTILELKTEDADLMRYFTGKIESLCNTILADCCIQLATSAEEAESAASSEGHANYLEVYQKISHDTATKYHQMCSSSEDSIPSNFLAFVPHLIQDIKAIFRDQMIPEVQNGMWGLPKDALDRMASQFTEAKRERKIRQLVCEVCKILEELCVTNCDSQHPADLIKKWGESLGIWSMLEFLKPFFQKSPADARLHKRLELFSRCTRAIISDELDADQVFMLGFFDVSFSLIHFAKFDPAKVVRFELSDSTNSPVTCGSEGVKYDSYKDRFSQLFCFRKEEEDELLLRAVAHVHVNGQVHQRGAFQFVITLPASEQRSFDTCFKTCKTRVAVNDIAVTKVDVKNSQNIQVALRTTQKLKLVLLLDNLRKEPELKDVVDWKESQVNPCHFTVRTVVPAKPRTVLRLRLIYKWKFDEVFTDSEDFVAHADPSAESTSIPDVQFKGMFILLWLNICRYYLAKLTLTPNSLSLWET